MSTRSSARNIFPPLDNPELTIRRRSRTNPTLLNNSKMAAEGPDDLPVPDLRTMEELCQPSLNGGTFMKRRPEECYDLIENITAHHNDWDTSAQRSESSDSITSSSDTEITALKAEIAKINRNLMRVLQPPLAILKTYMLQEPIKIPQPQVVTTNEFTNFIKANDAIFKNMQTNMTSLTNLNLELKNMFGQFMKMNTASSLGSRTLLVECETKETKDKVHPTNNRSTEDFQPLIVPTESPILNSEPVISPIIEPVASPVSAPKPNQRPSIANPSKLQDQKLCDKANDQREKFFQIFKDLNFNISFTDALILMSKFSPSIKSLLTNKDKLNELARTPLNEHCLTVLLKKLPEKLGDPGKFLIPCDFPRMAECLALADLGASINQMPLSVWNKLLLPDLSPMCMTLELVDRLISHPVGVAEDVFVKVGTFYFPADFVVVDFDADPRTSRYSANYNDMTANRIDVIDMACEEYSQEVLGFSDVIASGNPTPYYDPTVSTTSPTLTPFGNCDFLLEEVDAFLALEVDPTSPEVDQSYVDTEGDILLLEAFLNDDPSLPPPNQGNYLPKVRKELKICEAKTDKSSIDQTLEVELKGLPPYLKYVFLEGDDKLPVIIAKYLSVGGENRSYNGSEVTQAIHCLETLQYQGVNPKIHDVIKNEVLKLLDAGLIYPISDSPWVSPLHYVAKKGGFTVVENEENELIPTHLVTGWRVCIDYRETTFTCPYRTFAYCHMPFGLCNAPGTFQRCMMAIFHDMMEKIMEVFMDEFLVFRNSFQTRLSYLERMLKRCEDTILCLNWEKSHFMVKEGIVLSHKISKEGIEVDKAKVDVISKLPHPTTVKGIHSFLGHADFYRRFIKDFSKIARPMTRLLEKDTPFLFSKECVESFQTLKRKLTEDLILIALNWDMPFELMCDASDFAIESNYTTTEKEMLAVVYAFKKFWSYLIMNKSIVYTDHSTLKYLFAKKDSKARLLRWVLILQEFTFKVIDTKGAENLAADHLSRLENPHQNVLDPKEINESFPLETLNLFSSRGNSSTPPFTISHVFPYGTVELSQPDGPNYKVNGHRLKHYFREDVPTMVVPDLQTFSKDH
nr:reverse transcriptase domain-containing protein [Tanacetum cinerariifolium]